jgi:hypothetical protein
MANIVCCQVQLGVLDSGNDKDDEGILNAITLFQICKIGKRTHWNWANIKLFGIKCLPIRLNWRLRLFRF